MTPAVTHKIAAAGVGTSWVLWIYTNIAQINAFLQAFALIAAIVSSLCAARYYWRKSK